MDKVKNHFENEATVFDRVILNLIPHYPTMIRTLVEAVPFEKSKPLHVIDLGCGTGTVAAKILDAFPNARVTCVDMAENMIAVARAKLKRYSQVKFVAADFNAFEFRDNYDVVVSSLALHHLRTDEDKQNIYRRIYESLNPGGVFYNADVVLASNDFLQSVYMNEWREFMSRAVPKDEIENKWIPTYKEEDHPARLLDQLAWMKEIGFGDVDVLWKYFNFAVYGGVRSTGVKFSFFER
jgi:tRNA (cmo5U34)-methyltransferase